MYSPKCVRKPLGEAPPRKQVKQFILSAPYQYLYKYTIRVVVFYIMIWDVFCEKLLNFGISEGSAEKSYL